MEYETMEHAGYTIRIEYDPYPLNPRAEYDNFGIMVCEHRHYDLGDPDGLNSLRRAVWTSRDYRPSWDEDTDWGSLADVCQRAMQCSDIVMLPLYLYDHGGITMNTTGFYSPWDSGQVGVIFTTREAILRELGGKILTKEKRQRAENILRAEVETYDQFLTGEVFGFVIEDADGNHLDSCWGFYGADYCIKQAKEAAEYLREGEEQLMATAG